MKTRHKSESSSGKEKGKVFVISGPSGSGKTTLVRHLLKDKELRNKFVRSISLTTRRKRVSEKDKSDYFFIREEKFRQNIKAKKILEWTKYLGYYYGTPKDVVERQIGKGKSVILCLDIKGAISVRRIYPKNSITIFVRSPSLGELEDRIVNRGDKTRKEEITKRLNIAKKELSAAKRYDYCIMNKDLSIALKKLKGILLNEISV